MLHHTDDQTANHVNSQNKNACDGITLHKFRRTIHRAVKVGLAGDVFAAFAGLLVRQNAGIQIGIDCHLLAGHRIERKARRDFRYTPRTLHDHDHVDDHQDQEHQHADNEIAADNELAK